MAAQRAPARAGGWIIATTVVGSSIAFVDTTVVNVALPVIQRQLHATGDEAQWVIEAFALVLAGCILLGGAFGDKFGRRGIYVAGTAIFGLSSIACGLATSVSWLIAARAIQGAGAALLIPGSLAILGACFEGGARARAIGTWSAFTAIAPAAGPVLGGMARATRLLAMGLLHQPAARGRRDRDGVRACARVSRPIEGRTRLAGLGRRHARTGRPRGRRTRVAAPRRPQQSRVGRARLRRVVPACVRRDRKCAARRRWFPSDSSRIACSRAPTCSRCSSTRRSAARSTSSRST